MLADLGAILAIYNEAVLTTTASADTEPQTLAVRAAWYDDLVRQGYPVRVAVALSVEVSIPSMRARRQPRAHASGYSAHTKP